ncbi:UDP-N-acetylhexosamine pyrophosphorylase [Octopus sinensis]|uniref:UDP-N-acetylglucosamine diphosphorylase n=1 Tax=Octopus sinensis TaxID=2607531 RepID=A0A6P7T8I6_9MOLL|nr:UDP-N-acetylhexosamine pyrophosphorylase [Octopus sinensis]
MESIKPQLEKYGQEHLVKFWNELSKAEQNSYLEELKKLNLEEITGYFKNAQETLKAACNKIDDLLQPLPSDVYGSFQNSSPEQLAKYYEKGLKLIAENKLCVLLLAGGQGTRLGVKYPKGMYNVGLPSGKTLYQLQAERILKLQKLAGNNCSIPWYIMTSDHTKESTELFFEKHGYFGLKKENVVIFQQFLLPCLTFGGKIINNAKNGLAMAPDGNGGLYKALREHGVLQNMKSRGIQYIHAYCVDNILVKMADPIFMAYCVDKKADCGAKVVKKAFPTEPVGVVCKVDGKFQVVEYSEITTSTAEKQDKNGQLLFNAGNICNHFFTLGFLDAVCNENESELKHHIAKKKIGFIDEKGEFVQPSEPNGIKMEKFVFDVFKFSKNFAVWEVVREDEFSPLKNADGKPKDTPTTCRLALQNLHCRYIVNAGGTVKLPDGSSFCENDDIQNTPVCEISPLVSYAGEGLEKLVRNKTFAVPVTLTEDSMNGI